MEKGPAPKDSIHAPLTQQGISEPQNAAVEEPPPSPPPPPPPKKAEYNFITPGMRWNRHACWRTC